MSARTDFTRSSRAPRTIRVPISLPESFLPLMITNPWTTSRCRSTATARQQRDWLHVEDNCRGVLAVLEEENRGGLKHRRPRRARENLTLAQRLLRLLGKPRRCSPTSRIVRATDRRYALHCREKWRTNSGGSPRLWARRRLAADDRVVHRRMKAWLAVSVAANIGLLRKVLRQPRFLIAPRLRRSANRLPLKPIPPQIRIGF